jgi:hypothetical protein
MSASPTRYDGDICIFAAGGGQQLSIDELRLLHGGCSCKAGHLRAAPILDLWVVSTSLCDWRLSDSELLDDRNFVLKHKCYYRDVLKDINPVARDSRIKFIEDIHAYVLDDKVRAPWSVTRFAHYCAIEFDPDAVLAKCMSDPGWAARRGYAHEDGQDMTADEIKSSWRNNGISQSRRGTLLHWHVECHFNGYIIKEPHSPEFELFLRCEKSFLDALGFTPWRVEMNMFHCGLRLAGQADLVCKDRQGKLVIIDWKRTKDMRRPAYNDERQKPPLAHLPNTKLYLYYLQVNTYRFILETEYGYSVSGMYLVVLHPAQEPGVPHVFQVPCMDDELRLLVQQAHMDKGTSLDSFEGAESIFDVHGLKFE